MNGSSDNLSQAEGEPPAKRKLVADPTFGYLDFLEDPALGVTGGYLIVSATGRPLEFHCTAPVLANRAQHILFGPTLRPYLLGEQIGTALVTRAKLKPTVLAIADRDQLAAAGAGSPPVVFIERATTDSSSSSSVPSAPSSESTGDTRSEENSQCAEPSTLASTDEQPDAHQGETSQREKDNADHWRQLPAIEPVVRTLETDVDALAHYLSQLAGSIDLAEPLDRIRGAIREAQRLGQDEATDRHAA